MTAIDDIAAERKRQIDAEGWSPDHDDEHDWSEMLDAAICYTVVARRGSYLQEIVRRLWPWDWSWWKPTDRRRSLVKAGALIVAEIERLDRASAAKAA
jgi:hypothetical protein